VRIAPERQVASSSALVPVVTVTRNWLALSLVAPSKDGAASNDPSAAVVTVRVRTDADPPGGIGSPLR